MSTRKVVLPLLRREYLGFTGLIGHLTNDYIGDTPTWKESSSPESPAQCEFTITIASKVSALKTLVENNVNYPTLKDSFGKTPVHLICSVNSPGQVEALQVLCSANKAAVNVLDHNDRTPLHHALSLQNIKYHTKVNNGIHLVLLIKALINFGANVNALDVHGISPLHLAMHGGRLMELPTILKMFVDAGADLLQPVPARNRVFGFLEYIGGDDDDDMSDPDRTTVIHLVCRMIGPISIQAMKAIITPQNVNLRESYRRTPLHDLIVSIGQTPAELQSALDDMPEEEVFLQKMNYLLDLGAKVNAVDVAGATPICIALQKYRFTICSQAVDKLLSRGAVTNVQFSEEAITPMHLLCRNFNDVIPYFLPRFIEAGGHINAADGRNQTPLFYALKNGDCAIDVLEHMCGMGADIMAIDAEGSNGLHVVCGQQEPKSAKVVAYLVKKGCNINWKNFEGDTPLLVYLRSGDDPEFVQTLIWLGADASATNDIGTSALHLLCQTGQWRKCSKKIIQLIIREGANVNAKDRSNSTPLLYEMKGSSNVNTVRALLDAGADPNVLNAEVPLHIAASEGNHHLTKLLLAYGADINVVDINGRTPLHRATSSTRGDINETVMTLIHGGASPSVMDFSKRTPVMSMTYKTSELFISYIALLISTERYSLTEEEEEFFGGFLEHYFSVNLVKCLEEAPRLNNVFIGNITLTEFLLRPADGAWRWVRNPEIEDAVRRTWSFQQFSRFIKEKWAFLDHLNDLDYEALLSLNLLYSGKLPLVVTEKILSKLAYQDKLSLSMV